MENRLTYYDGEFGSYFPFNKLNKMFYKDNKWDLINYIGQLEDKIEELQNGTNTETTART